MSKTLKSSHSMKSLIFQLNEAIDNQNKLNTKLKHSSSVPKLETTITISDMINDEGNLFNDEME